MKLTNKSGFTLLEVIIVIIIIAILASVGMPKLSSMTNKAKAKEGLSAIPLIRSDLEQCYLMSNNTYAGCTGNGVVLNGKYFTTFVVGEQDATEFTITLTCPLANCGVASTLIYRNSTKSITGTGAFSAMNLS